MADANIKVEIKVNSREIKKALREAQRSLDKMYRLYKKYLTKLIYEQLIELSKNKQP